MNFFFLKQVIKKKNTFWKRVSKKNFLKGQRYQNSTLFSPKHIFFSEKVPKTNILCSEKYQKYIFFI